MNIKILSLALAVITFSGTAIADTVTTPAPSSTTATKSTYDWTGVYVGGFVGGATGANVSNSVNESVDFVQLGGIQPQFATSTSKNSSTNASFMGGGTVGYNWQIPKTPYLIGLEGEYGYLGMSGNSQSQSAASSLAYSTQNKTTIGSDYGYGLVGGRLGYALNRTLFYVKSGAVFTQVNTKNTTTDIVVNQPPYTGNPAHTNGTTTGYALGGGLEYAPSLYNNKNLTIKMEYLYFGIPTSTHATGTVQCSAQCHNINSYSNSTSGISTAKIGVNYKF